MPCATNTDECSLIDEFKYDGRNAELKLKDAPSDAPLAIHPAITQVSPTHAAAADGWYPTRSPPPGPRAPLNVLYCVYLD